MRYTQKIIKKIQKSRNPGKLEKWLLKAAIQIYIASKNIFFSSNADCSIPSNSPHYTKMNCIPNIWTSISSKSPLQVIQQINYRLRHNPIPNKHKTNDQNSWPISQWRSKWSMDSPLFCTCSTTRLQLNFSSVTYPLWESFEVQLTMWRMPLWWGP